jgi:hypothetical protein
MVATFANILWALDPTVRMLGVDDDVVRVVGDAMFVAGDPAEIIAVVI